MGGCYRQLTREERRELARLQAAGRSFRQIAAALDRAPATIAREVKRNGSSRQRGAAQPIVPLKQGAAFFGFDRFFGPTKLLKLFPERGRGNRQRPTPARGAPGAGYRCKSSPGRGLPPGRRRGISLRRQPAQTTPWPLAGLRKRAAAIRSARASSRPQRRG